ncbi:Alpha/Beta hydrolase protein [Aspergillus karnatakaensis]|uniref:Alpha/Beta hydrolase protein n=1 Tax=Aspergillus karnatakaensis TaxID=1810916 RepID=UPI003CCE2C15
MSPGFRLDQAPTVPLPVFSDPSHIQTVVGKRSAISDNLEEFRGIPYASVLGRWEHSRLRDHLPRDVFDATENGPRCPAEGGSAQDSQLGLPYPDVRQDEFECLNLFIIRPSKEALVSHGIDGETAQLPVLVYIHGGGFIDGAGTDPQHEPLYPDPTRLVLRSLSKKTPFIAVCINYRLGIFGFGGSSDVIAAQGSGHPVKGLNFGLYDQKLALLWVNRNIAAFGGDGTKITIMGHSAGGITCYLHTLEVELSAESPLFRKAGVLSGPVGGLDLTSLEKADKRWADLCQLWSVQAQSPAKRLDMLRRVPTKELLRSVSKLHWKLFTLIVDGLTIRESNLGCGVSVHFGHDGLGDEASPPKRNIQLLISAADEEFRGFALMANWDYSKFYSLFTLCYPSKAAAEEVLQAYNILPTSSASELREAFSRFISDSTMTHKVYRGYEFFRTHRGKQALLHGQDPRRVGVQYRHLEIGDPLPGPLQGIAHHSVELIYAFGNFYQALEKADQETLQGSTEPNQAHGEARAVKYRQSNIDLSSELQDSWIRFVVEDCPEADHDQHADVDQITTFCADRSVRAESWSRSEKWMAKRKKLELLDKDFDSITIATQRLVGSVLGMAL